MRSASPAFAPDPDDPERWCTTAPIDVGRWRAIDVATEDGPPGPEFVAWLEHLAARTDALHLAVAEELLVHFDREHFLGLGVDASVLPDERAESMAEAFGVLSIEVEDMESDAFELELDLAWDDEHLVTVLVVDGEVESASFDG